MQPGRRGAPVVREVQRCNGNGGLVLARKGPHQRLPRRFQLLLAPPTQSPDMQLLCQSHYCCFLVWLCQHRTE